MYRFLLLSFFTFSVLAADEPLPALELVPDAPELPGRIKSGEAMEPDSSIIDYPNKVTPQQENSELPNDSGNDETGDADINIIRNKDGTITIVHKDSHAKNGTKIIRNAKSGNVYEFKDHTKIITYGTKSVEKIEVVPIIGPHYYFLVPKGDGGIDVRSSDLDRGSNINVWKIFEWN